MDFERQPYRQNSLNKIFLPFQQIKQQRFPGMHPVFRLLIITSTV